MGNWWSATQQPAKPHYEVVLPSGCRAWEQLYSGHVHIWESVADRYGMDKFAYSCGLFSCDREAVCLRYLKASLLPSKQTVNIERYKLCSRQVPASSSSGLRTLLSEGFQLNEVIAAERRQLIVLVLKKSIDDMSKVAFPLIHLGDPSDTDDRKKGTDKARLPWQRSSRKEQGGSKGETKKRPSRSSVSEKGPEDRQVNGRETDRPQAAGDGARARCLGVLHAPHKDMTVISCHLSPDLSQTAIMFFSFSKETNTFCYTLHFYSNLSLQEESPQDAQSRALSSAAALDKKAESASSGQQTPHLLQTVKLSREVQPYFVYDPRYRASRIAVANYECRDTGIEHELVVLSLGGAGDAEKDVRVIRRGKMCLPTLFGNNRFNLLYSKDGELIILQKLTDDRFGVTSFCDIYIFSSDDLTLMKYLTSSLPGLFHICKVSYEPVFSRCGSYMRILDHHLSTSSTDAGEDDYTMVQIYQLPRSLSLMSQCRKVILQHVSSCHSVDLLPLPHKLMEYLRFGPIY